MSKFIFVTGGVVSSLGKSITTASLGKLLTDRGLKVDIVKFDPYLNVDTGTMNPTQHGEIFVTYDGCETDMAIGSYERFMNIELDENTSHTTGKIYSDIIIKERKGDYLGSTIQVVPHVTSEIKAIIKSKAKEDIDVVIVEIGGTVGDIEGQVYLEALRQLTRELKMGNYLHIHCTLLPYLSSAGEIKTKPTQHSVRELTTFGLFPDIIVCRTEKGVEVTDQHKRKIAMFCNLDGPECVAHIPDCETIYEVPLVLNNQGLDRIVCHRLNLPLGNYDMTSWRQTVEILENEKLPQVNIAIVGKYTEIQDAYISVIESVKHACVRSKYRAKITIVSSEDVEVVGAKEILRDYDGIIVPGGFGSRGIEGKIMTAKYCRENKIPYLGLCLGMQVAVIEFARNVLGLSNATSTEFDMATSNPVIDLLDEQKDIKIKGGSMRLGNRTVTLTESTLARRLYGVPAVEERHRHRYTLNNNYAPQLLEHGMIFSGINTEGNIVEIIEYKDHPFFLATQFHPEFKSRPNKPHSLFVGFVSQAIANIKKPTILR